MHRFEIFSMQLGQSFGLIRQLHAQLVCGGQKEDPAAFYDVRTCTADCSDRRC